MKSTKISGAHALKLPQTGSGLLKWWLDGLRCNTPGRLRKSKGSQYLLELSKSHADLVYEHKGTYNKQGMLSLKDPGLTATLHALSRRSKHVALRLKRGEFLTHRVTLPGAVESNLRQVIGFEMDRITPFSADSVYFDGRVVERHPEQNQLLVEIALVQRSRVEPWLKVLAESDVKVAAIEAEGIWEDANLLPPEQISKVKSEQGSNFNWLLAFIVLLLTAAALAGPLWQKREVMRELESRLETARKQSDLVIELRNRVEQQDQLNRFVAEKRLTNKQTVDLLNELTLLLPDNTWLQQLEIKNGRIDIRGESIQASVLIEILESSPLFHSVRFRSPVVGIQTKSMEKFHIGMDISPGDEE